MSDSNRQIDRCFMKHIVTCICGYVVMIVVACSLISCSTSDTKDHNIIQTNSVIVSDTTKVGEWKDPLFFIENQLCQHMRHIYEDKRGDLWLGTNVYGLMRYSAGQLIKYDKASGHSIGRVTSINEDKNGDVWASYDGGICRFDGKELVHFPLETDGYENEMWDVLIDSKGKMWVSSTTDVTIFEDGKYTVFEVPMADVENVNKGYASGRVGSMMETDEGVLWFATSGYGITTYDGKEFSFITTEDGLPDNSPGGFLQDSQGRIWISTGFGGISMYEDGVFHNYTKDGLVQGIEVGALSEDKKGNIWFAAENSGVYKYDMNGRFTHWGEDEGLPTNGILSILEDSHGQMWFGGWGGLFRLEDGKFVTIGEDGPWGI